MYDDEFDIDDRYDNQPGTGPYSGQPRRGEGTRFRDPRMPPPPPPQGYQQRTGWLTLLPPSLSKAVLAAAFIVGIGTGVAVDTAINTDPRDLASRDAIDRNAPNPSLCQRFGSSAMVLDERVYVTFNPFSVYVSQADTKPGCVLRMANVVPILKARGLISDPDLEACKLSNNTWGFIGDVFDRPQLNCLYQSDDAQNEFLSNPKIGLGEDVYDSERKQRAKEELAKAELKAAKLKAQQEKLQ